MKQKFNPLFRAVLYPMCCAAICASMCACSLRLLPSAAPVVTPAPTPTVTPTPMPTPEPTPIVSTVRFSASGDNLIHSAIYKAAAVAAQQKESDKRYDFDFCYEHIADFYRDFDVNWINQETLINDACEASTYPTFSTPIEMGDALYNIGMRVFSLANNHTYDKGARGVAGSLDFWETMPEDIVTTGLWEKDSYDDIPMHEVNGMKIAYLSYTFSTNGIPEPKDTVARIIYTSEVELIESQVIRAKECADFVIVGVHWGVEDSHNIVSSQTTLAQNLTEWGADVIVGTHPHVLQDCEWLTAQDGSATFVVYSLGNYISTQSKAPNLIGGILDVTLQKTIALDGSISYEVLAPVIHTTVTHYGWGRSSPCVYLYSDYTPELAKQHGVLNYDTRFTYDFIAKTITSTISDEFIAPEDARIANANAA